MNNLFSYICDHKFSLEKINNDEFNICNNPNSNNFLCDYCDVRSTIMIIDNNEIICNCDMIINYMNNMDIAAVPLTDDEYDNMDVDDDTCKIFFSDNF